MTPGPGAIEGLALALGKTLGVVAIGYVMGSAGFCDPAAGKGLNQFLSWVAFPAFVFHGLATMDLSRLSWSVYSAILVSKIVPMVAMIAIVFCFSSACMSDRWKMAGILGMFVTMTNDVAIGLPIVQAVYPEFTSYLYLPQQHVLFNPVALIFLEVGATCESAGAGTLIEQLEDSSTTPRRVTPTWVKLLRNILTNHVLLISFVGLAMNLLCQAKLPQFLDELTEFIGQAFAAGALFSVGLAMVGKGRNLRGQGLVWPLVVTLIKIVLSANVGRYYAVLIEPEWKAFHDFSYVYGSLPVGVPCFLFAVQYDAFPEIVSGAIVLALVLSAPAVALAVVFGDYQATMNSIVDIQAVLSGASGVAAVFVAVPFLGFAFMRSKVTLSGLLVLHLTITIVANCICYELCLSFFCQATNDFRDMTVYIARQFFRQQIEVLYTVIAIHQLRQITKGPEEDDSGWGRYYFLVAWIVPALWCFILPVAADMDMDRDPSCWVGFGKPQMLMEVCILLTEAAIIVGCFVFATRHRQEEQQMQLLADDSPSAPSDERSIHTSRVYLLLVYWLVWALFKCLWLVFNLVGHGSSATEPVEVLQKLLLVFVDELQGVVLFMLFLLSYEPSQEWYRNIFHSARRRWRLAMYDTEEVSATSTVPLDQSLVAMLQAMASPEAGLMKNFYWGGRRYLHVMKGSSMVDWMVSMGYASSRAEAVNFGQTLLEGGTIYHVTLEHNFHDKVYFYHVDRDLLRRLSNAGTQGRRPSTLTGSFGSQPGTGSELNRA